MSKAQQIPFSEDKTLRGDNKIQEVVFNAMIYGDTALSSNGLTIRLKTFEREISIYNIEVHCCKDNVGEYHFKLNTCKCRYFD